MVNCQLYPCTLTTRCECYPCNNRSAYLIANRDMRDTGTEINTGYRICAECAVNLARNMTEELRGLQADPVEEMSVSEFAEEVAATANEVFASAEITVVMPEPLPEAEDPAPEEETEDEGGYRCLDCNREFINKGSYMRHMQSAIHKK